MTTAESRTDGVGPVLEKGAKADAVIAAIQQDNENAEIIDRGSYVRVLVPRRCKVLRSVIEAHARHPFVLPSDLEMIMPSFKGRLEITEDQVTWKLGEHEGE